VCGKRACYEESFRFSVGHHGICLGGSGFTNCFSPQPVSWVVAVEKMFEDSVGSADTPANSHPGAKSKNQDDKTELAIRSRVRRWRDASWFGVACAHQLEDSKGESAERQKRNQKKYDFVTALHIQR
jgi:hypothetical protein